MRHLFLLAAACTGLHTIAQSPAEHDHRCIADRITRDYLQQQGLPTGLQAAIADIEPELRGGPPTIPVVFHVVWNTSAENIPASAIEAVVAQMNQDYSANNNTSGVRATFQGSIADTGIQFCLATTDPSGNPTDGITRTQTSASWFNPETQTNAMKAPPLGKSPWNPLKYLNIWVCDIHSGAGGGGITLGYAYLPVGGMVGSNIDGIVIDYLYGMALNSRTATHEAGHYLGLDHTWGDGGCSGGSDDGFSDTPNTDSPTFSCANPNLMKCGTLTQYENFMDYANCSAMFTNQQANYMNNVLNGVRSGLLTSDGCSGSGSTGYCVPTAEVGTSDGDFVNGVQLGSINNTNTGSPSGPAYTNYSATQSTQLVQGTEYTVTVQSGTYSPTQVAVWIDFNGDEVFQAGEKLGEFQTNGSLQSQGITFTVPAGATVGNTRMRVRSVYVNTGEPNPADPCFNYTWGETEDYGIVITAPAPTGYCIPTSANGTSDGDFVNSVQLGAIQNVNSGGTGAPTYANNTAQSTTLAKGAGYTITIQSGQYSPNRVAAWIDYNGDETFQVGEKLGEFQTNGSMQSQGIDFTVPMSAALGTTRLRVRSVYVNTGEPNPADPCFNYAWGETEDYSVTIDGTVGIDDAAAAGLALYPNPARGVTTLVLPDARPARVDLMDMQGRTVRSLDLRAARHDLDLGGLASGNYAVRVAREGQVHVLRLTVEAGR
ncbi:MAG: GEVED domain-containing protein [Flavobacteriales bacterium]|jgi:hypothetical protein|nr:GEVED domain-containing protein [Flavobacteriales bacterium]